MAAVITVDGVEYDVKVPSGGIVRNARIDDGENADISIEGWDIFDTIGAYFDYTYTFLRDKDNVTDYDALYQVLISPTTRRHTIVVPYAQSTISFQAKVTSISDPVEKIKNSINYWGGMTVEFKATKPYLTP